MVVNRHLDLAQASCQYQTDSMARKHAATSKARSAKEAETRQSGTLNAHAQLSHVILNGPSATAGDFFFGIEIPSLRKTVREVGQCKLLQSKLTQATYDAEREKSAGSDDIFMLYTQTEISNDCALSDRSGLVDASCWDSYFGPFAGRAYMALQWSRVKEQTIKPGTPHPL
jgi:hypothetical protein